MRLPTYMHPVVTIFKGGLSHGFVVEFESAEDRDYYVKRDPAHQEFIAFVGPLVQQVKVVDFEPGKF